MTHSPIESYIFLFEYNTRSLEYLRTEYATLELDAYPEIFFAKQVVNNACATQAILSVLLNSSAYDIGDTLRAFKTAAMPLSPQVGAIALTPSNAAS